MYQLAISVGGWSASFGSPMTKKLTTSSTKNAIPVSGTSHSLLLLSIKPPVSAPPPEAHFGAPYACRAPAVNHAAWADGRPWPAGRRVRRHAAGADRDGAGRSRGARDHAGPRAPARLGRRDPLPVAQRRDGP